MCACFNAPPRYQTYSMDELVRLIAASKLFDREWYLRNNPDVAESGSDPLEHYLHWGAREGRDPNAMFMSNWYVEQNPDIAESGMIPLEHYIRVGAAQGRNPNPLFDTKWYLEKYPDVVESGLNVLEHYLCVGVAELREPNPLFDSHWYLKHHPDIAQARLNPFEHYLREGGVERRDPNPMFDGAWYLQNNLEIARAGINPLAHYLNEGARKGCDPNSIFDTDWYLMQNPDVAQSGMNPLLHYLLRGKAEGRSANAWMQDIAERTSKSNLASDSGEEPAFYVYTAILGGYDDLPTIVDIDQKIKFVAYTDTDIACSKPWSTVRIDNIFRDRKITSGFLKSNPELLFERNSIVVWIDANLRDIHIDRQVIRSWLKDSPVAAPPHLIRERIEGEKAIMEYLSVEDKICASRLWHQMRDLGFKDDQGLSATLMVVRDIRDPRVRAADRTWWDCILSGARRDQLSFNYALWSAGVECHRIDIDWRHNNRVFSVVEHKHQEGRTLNRQPFDPESAERIAWRALDLPQLDENCPEPILFHPEWWSSYALETIRLINQAVMESGEPLEGNYCYFHRRLMHPLTPPDPRRSWKREVLRRAVGVGESALEVGFNAGHSAVVMLDANPCLKLTAIDVAMHSYTRPCAEIIAACYPGRFSIHYGSSQNVLTTLAKEGQCDFEILHIDCGHGVKESLFDLNWMLSNAPAGCIVIVDDAYLAHTRDWLASAEHDCFLEEANLSLPTTGENRVFVRTEKIFTGVLAKELALPKSSH